MAKIQNIAWCLPRGGREGKGRKGIKWLIRN